MKIHKLDHVNVRTAKLETLVQWYVDVQGLESGFRPHFTFSGAWLYAGESVVIHLVGVDAPVGSGSEQALKLEHFAFCATGATEFEQTLVDRGEQYRRSHKPEISLVQYNIWDPDDNHIQHVDFPADE